MRPAPTSLLRSIPAMLLRSRSWRCSLRLRDRLARAALDVYSSLAERAAFRPEPEARDPLALRDGGKAAIAVGRVVERRVVAVREGERRRPDRRRHELGRVIG